MRPTMAYVYARRSLQNGTQTYLGLYRMTRGGLTMRASGDVSVTGREGYRGGYSPRQTTISDSSDHLVYIRDAALRNEMERTKGLD